MLEIATEEKVAAGKNAVIKKLKDKMGICPYFGTLEVLDVVLVQKDSWGGKPLPENMVRLSAAANKLYLEFAEQAEVQKNQPLAYYLDLFDQFVKSEKGVISEKERILQSLKHLVRLRLAFTEARKAMESRIRNKGKELDAVYPMSDAKKARTLEKFRQENEPLVDELKKGLTWENLITASMADMGYVSKSLIEAELVTLLEYFPVWTKWGKYIPGFGMWTCAFLIAKIGDPKRFADSADVRAYAGVAPKDGKPMRAKRGEKLNYDPEMKSMLLHIFPDSFMKICGKNPTEVYSKFFQACRVKQRQKAIETLPTDLATEYGVPVENVTPLGFETVDSVQVFKGFKVIKSGTSEPITTRNPGHVLQRSFREFGTMFLSDFYHVWLFLSGENPRIEGNPRIMAVFEKAEQVEVEKE